MAIWDDLGDIYSDTPLEDRQTFYARMAEYEDWEDVEMVDAPGEAAPEAPNERIRARAL